MYRFGVGYFFHLMYCAFHFVLYLLAGQHGWGGSVVLVFVLSIISFSYSTFTFFLSYFIPLVSFLICFDPVSPLVVRGFGYLHFSNLFSRGQELHERANGEKVKIGKVDVLFLCTFHICELLYFVLRTFLCTCTEYQPDSIWLFIHYIGRDWDETTLCLLPSMHIGKAQYVLGYCGKWAGQNEYTTPHSVVLLQQ